MVALPLPYGARRLPDRLHRIDSDLRFEIDRLAQSLVFPGNGHIVAAWLSTAERGRALAIFNSPQYFDLLVFAPIFGWITHAYGWQSCLWFMRVLGFALALIWFTNIYSTRETSQANAWRSGQFTSQVVGASSMLVRHDSRSLCPFQFHRCHRTHLCEIGHLGPSPGP